MFKKKTELRLIHTDQDLREVSKVLADSFINTNEVWKNMMPDYQDTYDIFYYKVFVRYYAMVSMSMES
jgi:uncharacterized membrane-anchored protein YhcB (DUF1043 family)